MAKAAPFLLNQYLERQAWENVTEKDLDKKLRCGDAAQRGG